MFTKTSMATALIVAFMLSVPSEAEACRCMTKNFIQIFNSSPDVVKARVTSQKVSGTQRIIRARIEGVYKGCLKNGKMLNITTSKSSASCGVSLTMGKTYVVSGSSSLNGTTQYMAATSCGLHVLVNNLTEQQASFLHSRYNCCGTTCSCVSGEPPVNCFANPCMIESCPEGTCESNYCGGCNSEYFNDLGQAVCNPCEQDSDCSTNMHCNDQKVCRTDCTTNADCPSDQWCRTTSTGKYECVPYAMEGENCGGGVAPWYLKRCQDGFNCVNMIPNMLGGPGHCLKKCAKNSDCDTDEYCLKSKQSCVKDGDCWTAGDCSASGNSWVHVMCAGAATCTTGHCGWKCGM